MSDIDIDFSDAFGPIDVEEQEAIEPAEVDETLEETEEVEGEEEQELTDPAESQQSADENAKYAAARRKAEKERDDAIAKMKEDHEKEMDSVIASLGLENPYTGKAITTRAEMESYKKQHAEEGRREIRERADLSDDDVRHLVESDPKYIEAMAAINAANEAKEAADRERFNQFIDNAIKEIGKDDPAIQSYEDLRKHESYPQVDALIKRGYSIEDAYYKANRDAIRARERAVIEQQIRNSMNGRSHLDSSSPRGDGGISVPADVMASYREIMPDASAESIRAYHAKYLKSKKK